MHTPPLTRRARHNLTLSLLICALSSLSACTSDEAEGARVIMSTYALDIAPGAIVQINISDTCDAWNESGKAPPIPSGCLNDTITSVSEMTSSAPEVMTVEGIADNIITLRALAPGEVTISAKVETRDTLRRTYSTLTRLTLKVHQPTRIQPELWGCGDKVQGTKHINHPGVLAPFTTEKLGAFDEVAFITGEKLTTYTSIYANDVRLGVEGMVAEDYWKLSGQPGATLRQVHDDLTSATRSGLEVSMPSSPGQVVLTSTFLPNSAETFHIFASSEITPMLATRQDISSAISYNVLGFVGDRSLCHRHTMREISQITVKTPDICEVDETYNTGEGEPPTLRALKAGSCEVEIRIGDKTHTLSAPMIAP